MHASTIGYASVYDDTCSTGYQILQCDNCGYSSSIFLYPVLSTDLSCPSIDSFENVMRLSGMTVQALWDTEPVFMQLPHIEADVLRHFYTKRVST